MAWTHKALLRLSEDEIKEQFPCGVEMTESGKWEPATQDRSGICRRTLKELLHEKRFPPEADRLLRASPSGPKDDPKNPRHWAGEEEHGYVTSPYQAMKQEGGAVDRDTQKAFTKEAEARHEVLHAGEIRQAAMRSRLARLKQLTLEASKQGADVVPLLDEAIGKIEQKRQAA